MPMSIKNVTVLMGGWSSEREVSLSSGQSVVQALIKCGYTVKPLDVKRDLSLLYQELTNDKPDVVFNALHGTGGEDGVIQGVLEILKIPYTHSGVCSSAVAMNKVLSRRLFEAEGIKTPPWKVMNRFALKHSEPFPVPYVIKPIAEGSSRGVFIVKETLPEEVLSQSWDFGPDVLLEKYLQGQEIQVGVMGNTALGAIEIRPIAGFYDYTAKYTDGKAEHLMPAPIPLDDYEKVCQLGLKAHKALGCRGVSRSDFIYYQGEFYLLELNTQPGLTPLSLLPDIAKHAGISFEELIEWITKNAALDASGD